MTKVKQYSYSNRASSDNVVCDLQTGLVDVILLCKTFERY